MLGVRYWYFLTLCQDDDKQVTGKYSWKLEKLVFNVWRVLWNLLFNCDELIIKISIIYYILGSEAIHHEGKSNQFLIYGITFCSICISVCSLQIIYEFIGQGTPQSDFSQPRAALSTKCGFRVNVEIISFSTFLVHITKVT